MNTHEQQQAEPARVRRGGRSEDESTAKVPGARQAQQHSGPVRETFDRVEDDVRQLKGRVVLVDPVPTRNAALRAEGYKGDVVRARSGR
jgi:hypothetical protein